MAARTPIVALTADAMSEAVHASLNAGCVAHVAKPVERGTLLKTIQRYANAQSRACQPDLHLPICVVSKQVRALVPQYLASKHRANRRSTRVACCHAISDPSAVSAIT